MSQTYRLLCLSEAASPITHISGTAGNEALVAREPVVTPRGVQYVPCLSGNAIRHRCVREPGMRWLVEQYGLAGKLTKDQLAMLFNGGNLSVGGGRENTRRIADMQRIWPLLRLVGGSLPDQIMGGSLLAGRGTLVCRENSPTLAAILPDDLKPLPELRPAESFVSGYQYVRADYGRQHPTLLAAPGFDGGTSQMIFAGQSVVRGATFVHDFTLQHVTPLALGALAWSLRLWQAGGGTIGGQSARGHGRLRTSVMLADGGPADLDGLVEEYKTYALSVKDEACAWLADAFRFDVADDGTLKPKSRKAKATAAGEGVLKLAEAEE